MLILSLPPFLVCQASTGHQGAALPVQGAGKVMAAGERAEGTMGRTGPSPGEQRDCHGAPALLENSA